MPQPELTKPDPDDRDTARLRQDDTEALLIALAQGEISYGMWLFDRRAKDQRGAS